MNDLKLPPHRPLPEETKDRIRYVVDTGLAKPPPARSRAPLAVAAGVAVLALGAALVAQSVSGSSGPPAGTQPTTTTTTTTAPATASTLPPVAVAAPDATTEQDLDRCGAVVAASPRAQEFPPRTAWEPVFTASAPEGVRVTAYREYGGKPGFCVVDATTASVTDPSREPMGLASGATGSQPIDVYALYVSPKGLMVGVAQGVDSLKARVTDKGVQTPATPVVRDELFVVDLGPLNRGAEIYVEGNDATGTGLARGELRYDPATARPVGATGPA